MNYPTSRDYDLLIRLMQAGHRLVCFADYRFPSDARNEPPCRDVCATRYEPPHKNPDEHYFSVSARGIGYAGGYHMTPDEFKKDCAAVHLEFIVPNSPAEIHPVDASTKCPDCGSAEYWHIWTDTHNVVKTHCCGKHFQVVNGNELTPIPCPDCGDTGFEEIDHGHYPCNRGCKPPLNISPSPSLQVPESIPTPPSPAASSPDPAS